MKPLAALLLGLCAGYALGCYHSYATVERLIAGAGRCVDRFDELAIETVRCARVVGLKPVWNRRRVLPYVEEVVTGTVEP